EALANAYRNLNEGLKIATIEKSFIQQLMNQIDSVRIEMRLLSMIDNVESVESLIETNAFRSCEFATISQNAISSNAISTNANFIFSVDKSTYNESMTENFLQLEKMMKEKMTKLMNRQTVNLFKRQQKNAQKTPSHKKNAKTTKFQKTTVSEKMIIENSPPFPELKPSEPNIFELNLFELNFFKLHLFELNSLKQNSINIVDFKINLKIKINLKSTTKSMFKLTSNSIVQINSQKPTNTWAQVVHKNIQKIINKSIKFDQSQNQKLIEKIDWKNKRLIMISRYYSKFDQFHFLQRQNQ
ncbi:MAG: hypothetical protein ICV68_15220, partial [Pyrinomonadaceae bacterium]|nr:hypothetical protein [Pyrinomonadaceae bacterium]